MAARALLLLAALPIAQARGSVLTAKEYICKDPDTGTLHTLNSTWHSTTFCGNYTCKLRKVNKTLTQPQSTIIVNVTLPQARVPDNNDNKNKEVENHKENGFVLSQVLSELTKDNDRLLNKEEIEKISEILPSVKKSDLQAIIELYSVAQEIYSGMNSDSPEKSRASETELQDLTDSNKKSYWYEPMNGYRKESDMKTEGSEYKQTATYAARSPYDYFYAQKPSSYSYFSGTLLNTDDFGRVGYYNHVANPQSLPSYYQPQGTYDVAGSTPSNPCSPCPGGYQYQVPSTSNTASRPNYYPPRRFMDNMMQPYYYNFSAQNNGHYNNYYKGNPWAYYDYYRNYPHPTNTRFQRNPYPNVINANGSPVPQQTTIPNENNVNSKEEDDKSWKTDPLSDTVINEVRANVAHGKLLNIPLKKRIKLERAAKVIKLDQFNNRKTRSVLAEANFTENTTNVGENEEEKEVEKSLTTEEEMETYVEKVTCPQTSDLGYFSLGNLTQPFPACCPQKIEDKQR